MKIKNVIFLSSLVLGAFSVSSVSADSTQAPEAPPAISSTTIEQSNHPMGYYTDVQTDENPMATPSEKTVRANAPDNLYSNDTSLPRKDAVDIASYQSWMTQADFNQLKAQGVKTVVVKLTEGTGYTNPYAKSHIQMARNAGLNIATYHFARFGDTSNQATANSVAQSEAAYYAAAAKNLGLDSNTVMIEDAEYSGTAASVWTQASQAFANKLKSLGYNNVKYYASKSWAENGTLNPSTLGAKNFWIAQYLYGKPSANNLQNTQYGAWQYTSQMYFTNFSKSSPLDTSIDYDNFFNTNLQPVYRVYNPNSGEHFYTMNYYEVSELQKSGWNFEGTGWYSVAEKTKPVYRLYNKAGGYHFYTLSSYEKDVLVKMGWRDEGISFYTGGDKTVYRAYNPNNGMHNYTLSSYEQNSLIKLGWKDEGIAWQSN